mmetsp:Transcript_18519/g.60656  ORF Transcript_18519/g.60656 Transcript_18519/m.60656 type:complete len:341 (-) Transcript_18519:228-1250(-)
MRPSQPETRSHCSATWRLRRTWRWTATRAVAPWCSWPSFTAGSSAPGSCAAAAMQTRTRRSSNGARLSRCRASHRSKRACGWSRCRLRAVTSSWPAQLAAWTMRATSRRTPGTARSPSKTTTAFQLRATRAMLPRPATATAATTSVLPQTPSTTDPPTPRGTLAAAMTTVIALRCTTTVRMMQSVATTQVVAVMPVATMLGMVGMRAIIVTVLTCVIPPSPPTSPIGATPPMTASMPIAATMLTVDTTPIDRTMQAIALVLIALTMPLCENRLVLLTITIVLSPDTTATTLVQTTAWSGGTTCLLATTLVQSCPLTARAISMARDVARARLGEWTLVRSA